MPNISDVVIGGRGFCAVRIKKHIVSMKIKKGEVFDSAINGKARKSIFFLTL